LEGKSTTVVPSSSSSKKKEKKNQHYRMETDKQWSVAKDTYPRRRRGSKSWPLATFCGAESSIQAHLCRNTMSAPHTTDLHACVR
jgi:hypothetical protein